MIQLLRDHLKRGWPCDRLIVGRVRVPHHWGSQTPLRVEPVIGFRGQVRYRIPDKEVRPDALLGRLVRHRLGAVLAKLKKLPLLVRARPCAALAVETSYLV